MSKIDYSKVKFKYNKNGVLEGWYEGKKIGEIYTMGDTMMEDETGQPKTATDSDDSMREGAMGNSDINELRGMLQKLKPSKKRVEKLKSLRTKGITGVTPEEDETIFFMLDEELRRQMKALGMSLKNIDSRSDAGIKQTK